MFYNFPDDDETPNTISIVDYSSYIHVESPTTCADCYHLYLESAEGLSNGLKTIVINKTGETIYIHDDFDFYAIDFGAARQFVIADEQFYLIK